MTANQSRPRVSRMIGRGLLTKQMSLGRSQPKVPPELENSVDSMVVQHLDLYDWGTSNPIYNRLESGFVQSTSTRGPTIRGVGANTPRDDIRTGGVFDTSATDQRLLTTINCGEGSYLERVSVVALLPLDELCGSFAVASA